MKRSKVFLLSALFIALLSLASTWGASLGKKIEQQAQKTAHTLHSFFRDPALGSLFYYASMAHNAPPIKEQIEGEAFINAAYHKLSPRILRQALQQAGTRTHISTFLKKDIAAFIDKYAIDMSDYHYEKPQDYKNFNEFFYRQLKPGVRKIDLRPTVVSSPADSKLRAIPLLDAHAKFFIKQEPFNLEHFLNDPALADRYQGGTLLVFRLAPADYHRFHFPFDCIPSAPEYISGRYETVNPIAFREGLWPISVNKRARIRLESKEFGSVIMVVVGACMIGSLNFTYKQNKPVKKGEEAGYFSFGGSTVCLLFKEKTITLPTPLITRSTHIKIHKQPSEQTALYEKNTAFETAVRMGQGIAMTADSLNVDLLSNPIYLSFLNKNNKEMDLLLENSTIPFCYNSGNAGK